MPDPFDDDFATPEPDEPIPPGVTPNHPKDPSVYGGQWGDTGGHMPGGGSTDRPTPIRKPAEPQGQGEPDAPPPTQAP